MLHYGASVLARVFYYPGLWLGETVTPNKLAGGQQNSITSEDARVSTD